MSKIGSKGGKAALILLSKSNTQITELLRIKNLIISGEEYYTL